MIELYTSPTPNGHKVSCTLEAMNLEYNAKLVNLTDGDQHKPEFLKIRKDIRRLLNHLEQKMILKNSFHLILIFIPRLNPNQYPSSPLLR